MACAARVFADRELQDFDLKFRMAANWTTGYLFDRAEAFFSNQPVILSARGSTRFLQRGGGKRRICFCFAQKCSSSVWAGGPAIDLEGCAPFIA